MDKSKYHICTGWKILFVACQIFSVCTYTYNRSGRSVSSSFVGSVSKVIVWYSFCSLHIEKVSNHQTSRIIGHPRLLSTKRKQCKHSAYRKTVAEVCGTWCTKNDACTLFLVNTRSNNMTDWRLLWRQHSMKWQISPPDSWLDEPGPCSAVLLSAQSSYRDESWLWIWGVLGHRIDAKFSPKQLLSPSLICKHFSHTNNFI